MSEAATRPSGLKPPSKIAKPTTTRTTNGALPRANGTVADGDPVTAAVDKLTRELARRRMSEADTPQIGSSGYVGRRMSEAPRKTPAEFGDIKADRRFSEDVYNKKKYSGGDLLSPVDLLYEQQRRLSEAGIRRGSDASVILTEDTESFIIGDRVWVGGSKPGHIQYIGETQFAPGEWAGVVLDEPTGKNDGSVGGVRYFMCEAKKGVFSRLTKLTREPLIPLGEELPGSNASSRAGSRKTTPVARDVKSPSPPFTGGGDVRLGEKVIVASSTGTKSGLLRYLGTTEFAPGEWAGVELDQPSGKNDGSVAGKRYFECRPKFGLFAPVNKVSKAPPGSRRLSSSAGLRRGGSRESLSSVTSSTSTTRAAGTRKPSSSRPSFSSAPINTALQETLKEKEQHIEQLLRERDLERSEVARSVSHADEMEKSLGHLQQEHSKLHKEQQASSSALEDKIKELAELNRQLEEERRKNEELEFRIEEESINMTDMQSKVTSDNEKIESLERQLKIEKDRVEQLEKATEDEFKTAEELSSLREQVETLQRQLTESSEDNDLKESLRDAQRKAKELQALYAEASDTIKCQDKEMEVFKKKLSEAAETEERLLDLRRTVGVLEEERVRGRGTEEALQQEIQGLRKRLTTQESSTEQLTAETQAQQMQVTQMKHQLKEADERYQQLSEIRQKLECELSAKIASSEDKSSEVSQMRENMKTLELQLEETKGALTAAKTEANVAKEEASQWKQLLEESKVKIQTEMKQQSEEYSKQVQDVNERLQQSEQNLLQSKRSLEEAVQKKEVEIYELQESNMLKESELSDLQEKIEKLERDLVSIRSSSDDAANTVQLRIQECQVEVDKYKKSKEEAEKNCREANHAKAKLETENLQLRRDMEEFKLRVSDRDHTVMKLTEEVNRLQMTFAAHKEKLEMELASNMQDAEACAAMKEQVLDARAKADDYQTHLQESREEVEKLTEQMNLTLSTVQREKEEMNEKMREKEKEEEKLREELRHVKEESNVVKENNEELTELLSKSEKDQTQLHEQLNESEKERAELLTQLSNIETHVADSTKREQLNAQQLKASLASVEREKLQLENKVVELQVAVAANQNTNVNHQESSMKEVMDEKETQIEFLNSVIVDMQRKNDELVTRLEVLQENYVRPSGLNNNRNGVKGHSVAPRLYCDICEEFDIHDTEDCPKQECSPSPPPTRAHGNRNEERPYCDTCEVFGHWTEHCDDTETF